MTLALKIESLTDDTVVLKLDDREIIWPRVKLPDDIRVGAILYFTIYPNKDLIKSETKIAEEILNEILKTS